MLCFLRFLSHKKNVKSVDERENEKSKREKSRQKDEKNETKILSRSLSQKLVALVVLFVFHETLPLSFSFYQSRKGGGGVIVTLSLSRAKERSAEKRELVQQKKREFETFSKGFDSRVRIGIFVRELEQKRPRVV